jgi:hypothetical protein
MLSLMNVGRSLFNGQRPAKDLVDLLRCADLEKCAIRQGSNLSVRVTELLSRAKGFSVVWDNELCLIVDGERLSGLQFDDDETFRMLPPPPPYQISGADIAAPPKMRSTQPGVCERHYLEIQGLITVPPRVRHRARDAAEISRWIEFWNHVRFDEAISAAEASRCDQRSDKAQPRPLDREVRRWFRARVAEWPDEKPAPNEKEDFKAAQALFGDGLSRAEIRLVRKEETPSAWGRQGKRPPWGIAKSKSAG